MSQIIQTILGSFWNFGMQRLSLTVRAEVRWN